MIKKAGLLKRAIAAMPDDTDLYVRDEESGFTSQVEYIEITNGSIVLLTKVMSKE
jgi:hypothetical protein